MKPTQELPISPIPLVDLKSQYQSIAGEVQEAVLGVLERGDFVLGRAVEEFENNFAQYCQAKFAVAVGSGLDALTLAIKGLGIGAGDEVITVANTFVATTLAIVQAGAKPVLVDCDPNYFNIDVQQIEKKITSKTKAILPVHLYGQPAQMESIITIACRHGLRVIEDACQAHGAEYQDRRAGSLGDAGCFSFYPGKNLGAYGDGGCLVTQDAAFADKVRKLRNYGAQVKYHHELQGTNSRLDTIQAAILNVKLKYLDEWNQKRRWVAAQYSDLLKNVKDVSLPVLTNESRSVFHLFVVRIAHRDEVFKKMQARGIGVGIHYPIPLHLMPCHADLGYSRGDFPVAEKCSKEILSLPIYPEMSLADIRRVSSELVQSLKA